MGLPQPHYLTGGATNPMAASGPTGFPQVDAPVLSCPFPSVNIAYVLHQQMRCLHNYWQPCPLNTPYDESVYRGVIEWPELGGYLLCEESERQDVGGGVVEWTRTYAQVPATHYQPTSINYRFIQFLFPTVINGTTFFPVNGRPSFEQTVTGSVKFEYFLLNDGESLFDVPTLQPYQYYSNQINSVARNIFADFLLPDTYPDGPTIPSIEEYTDLIGDATTPIIAQPSQIRRWMGNIIERQTIYIVAQ